ncbi:unannotated protein [freshwater metagenome]|uniref:Unannotated protein n=1 Tax=freshwater metagenome TaxID=449393 RepID=A0A6J7U069_9ZZZZ
MTLKNAFRLIRLPALYTARPSAAETTNPMRPPITTDDPDAVSVFAPSKNNAVSSPSRKTATNAIVNKTVFDEPSTLLRRLELKFRAFARIQKIICVKTNIAATAIAPSTACSTLPLRPLTKTNTSVPTIAQTAIATRVPNHTTRFSARRFVFAR